HRVFYQRTMKLLVLAASMAVVIGTVHSISQLSQLSTQERRSCRTRDCAFFGGVCVVGADANNCTGQLVDAGCGGRGCQCCIPEPTCNPRPKCCPSEGFFQMPAPSNQCFKLYMNRSRNWTEANELCVGEGLRLAIPYDALLLRSYIVQRFGPKEFAWVNARGNGDQYMWQGSETSSAYPFPIDSPLWKPGVSSRESDNYLCVVLAIRGGAWKAYPGAPYTSYRCTADFFTLCELP
ncbi:unnamed protein product, partial [Meganyctiphanes norvegica]